MPSRASLTQVSAATVGLRNSFFAESLTRAQWSSISGVTPSKALAPSNTTEQSQAACVRGPIIPMLPSCQSSLKYVQVFVQPSPMVNRILHAATRSHIGDREQIHTIRGENNLLRPIPGR